MHQWVDLINCWDRIEVVEANGKTRRYDRRQVELWIQAGYVYLNVDGKYQLRYARQDERLNAMAENLAIRIGNNIAQEITRNFPRLLHYQHLPGPLGTALYQICTDVVLKEFGASSATLQEIHHQHDQVS